MRVGLSNLKQLLNDNVCEIVFIRRRRKDGHPVWRRMLCTNSLKLLMSPEGRIALNYFPARNPPHFNPEQKNLIITWDLFMQDYRNVNMNNCSLISVMPVKNFWKYFNEVLAKMSMAQKMSFMDR